MRAAFDPAHVTAAILAGGAGSRLGGCDKGLEPLAGKPLIAHVLAALESQAGRVLICINRNEARYATYAPTLRDTQNTFCGPLAGIAGALAACATDWLLTVPVDCPRPPPHLAARQRAGAGACAAVANDGTRTQPLFALYRRELAASAASALATDAPVWRWQQEIGAREVAFADCAAAFANLNERPEFERWEREHG